MSSQISPDGEYIEIESTDRSEDAAGRPMFSRDTLVAERITYDGGAQTFKLGIEPSHGEGVGIYLNDKDAVTLRDWLIGLNL